MRVPPSLVFSSSLVLAAACSGARPAPAERDLTLAPAADVTTGAVVSARELGRPEIEHSAAPANLTTRVVRTRAKAPAPNLSTAAPAEAPQPEAEPNDAAPAAGGHELAPGQSVSVIPAISGGGPAPEHPSDYSGEGELRDRPTWHVHGDRCVPGRGEVIPRVGPPRGHIGL